MTDKPNGRTLCFSLLCNPASPLSWKHVALASLSTQGLGWGVPDVLVTTRLVQPRQGVLNAHSVFIEPVML